MEIKMYKYLFGPVPSRRLGISLGVDLVKNKRCNFNCVYCECGKTEEFTDIRDSYIEIDKLKNELKEALSKVTPDYITFSGSGEPTLNKDLGEIIHWIKKNYNIKTALITNSSLLYLDSVIEEIKEVDLIMPTLNSVTEEIFQKINRTSKSVSVENVKLGLKKLSDNFNGEVYLEFFIIEGLNDTLDELGKYVQFLKEIKYTKLQLNTLARKGAEEWVAPAKDESLKRVLEFFKEHGIEKVEIIKKLEDVEKKIEHIDQELEKNMFEKRSYTPEELEKIYKNQNKKNK